MLNAKFPLKGYLFKSSPKKKKKGSYCTVQGVVFISGMTCGAVMFPSERLPHVEWDCSEEGCICS